MRSKFTTYLLIVVVVALWGIIIKKIFFSKPNSMPTHRSSVRKEPQPEEPAILLLDYRDPFRPKSKSIPVVTSRPRPKPKPEQASKRPQPESVRIRFLGRLQCGDELNYIVDLNGKQHTLSLGEEADGFRLERAFPDSLHFIKSSNVYTLPIE